MTVASGVVASSRLYVFAAAGWYLTVHVFNRTVLTTTCLGCQPEVMRIAFSVSHCHGPCHHRVVVLTTNEDPETLLHGNRRHNNGVGQFARLLQRYICPGQGELVMSIVGTHRDGAGSRINGRIDEIESAGFQLFGSSALKHANWHRLARVESCPDVRENIFGQSECHFQWPHLRDRHEIACASTSRQIPDNRLNGTEPPADWCRNPGIIKLY